MDEAERIACYAPNGEAEGLLAYALHRRALLAFRADFAARHARAPELGEEAAFLIGEESPERIAAYCRDARAMMGAPATPPEKQVPVKKRMRFPFFGQWIEAPPNYNPDQPVNWRGLMVRLVVLLLAVVATAVLMRVLFVKA